MDRLYVFLSEPLELGYHRMIIGHQYLSVFICWFWIRNRKPEKRNDQVYPDVSYSCAKSRIIAKRITVVTEKTEPVYQQGEKLVWLAE